MGLIDYRRVPPCMVTLVVRCGKSQDALALVLDSELGGCARSIQLAFEHKTVIRLQIQLELGQTLDDIQSKADDLQKQLDALV